MRLRLGKRDSFYWWMIIPLVETRMFCVVSCFFTLLYFFGIERDTRVDSVCVIDNRACAVPHALFHNVRVKNPPLHLLFQDIPIGHVTVRSSMSSV